MTHKDNLDYDYVGYKCLGCDFCKLEKRSIWGPNMPDVVTCDLSGVTKQIYAGQYQKECPLKNKGNTK